VKKFMMIRPAAVFADSNVIIYAMAERSLLHEGARAALMRFAEKQVPICVSSQVIREVMVCLTRPGMMDHPLSPKQAAGDAARLETAFSLLEDNPRIRLELYSLVSRYEVSGKQVHDANIVATMRVHGVDSLITHNSKHFQRYAGLIEVVPLAA
jgi:predicted nucleic acid-binding protein